jgi:hypothetical protein
MKKVWVVVLITGQFEGHIAKHRATDGTMCDEFVGKWTRVHSISSLVNLARIK